VDIIDALEDWMDAKQALAAALKSKDPKRVESASQDEAAMRKLLRAALEDW
jgi:hypothetical protein